MYKKVRASGSFTPFKGESPDESRAVTPSPVLSLLDQFRGDLKKDKVQGLVTIALSAEALEELRKSGRVTTQVPRESCKAGCFYKTENYEVVYVEKASTIDSAIDLIEVKYLEGDSNG